MKISENIKESINRSVKARRIVLATASKDGIPNAVPIGIVHFVDDETLLLVDNYFLKTRANLESNPYAALTFWDMEFMATSAYQLKGSVKVECSGQLYEKMRAEIKAINPNYSAKAIVLLKVEEIYDVRSGPNAGKKLE